MSVSRAPVHPLTQELIARHPDARDRLVEAWGRFVPHPRAGVPRNVVSDVPLVASARLWALLQERTEQLCAWLTPQLEPQSWSHDPVWGAAPAADVLSLDLAVVASEEHPDGWDLRWVEFQAFTSIATSVYTLALASQELWPELASLRGDAVLQPQWLQQYRQWVAPSAAGVILEHAPWQQSTRFDLAATSYWLGLPLIEPCQLVRDGARLRASLSKRAQPQAVEHVVNRLILNEDPQVSRTRELLAGADVGWHSHPAWFYRVHKGLLTQLPLAPAERCASAQHWRKLGRPANELVLKAMHSFGGKAVLLHITERELDQLARPEDWLVQPRYKSVPLAVASDGASVFGEIRCIVALQRGVAPWTAVRFARLFRGGMASSSSWTGAPGEGVAVVYGPPADSACR